MCLQAVNHTLYVSRLWYFVVLLTGVVKPSVLAFDAVVSGPLSQFLSSSSKLAGDVQAQVCLCPKSCSFLVLKVIEICKLTTTSILVVNEIKILEFTVDLKYCNMSH